LIKSLIFSLFVYGYGKAESGYVVLRFLPCLKS
jgi:hypothetical protein